MNCMPLLLAVSLLLPCAAGAREPAVDCATVELRDDVLQLVAAVDAALFAELDRDGNGAIERVELGRARGLLQARFIAAVSVRDERGRAPRLHSFDMGVGDRLPPGGRPFVRFEVEFVFEERPGAVRVGLAFGHETELYAVRLQRDAAGRWQKAGPGETVRLAADGKLSEPLLASR